MKTITLLPASVAAMLLSFMVSASAQSHLTWVSSYGSGSVCTRAAPCASFAAAYAATLPGGEINCVDTGNFSIDSPLTITKSITIDCGGTIGAFTGNLSGNPIRIQGDGIVVTLRNLTIMGSNANSVGIDFQSSGGLFVVNCILQSFNGAPAIGIRFRPSAGAQLVVTDTVITNNGSGPFGGGIVVSPQAGGYAFVVLNRVTVSSNAFGIAVDGTGSTTGINMTITDSVISGNSQDGIIAVTPSGGAPIGVLVKNTKSVNNSRGIRSIGPNVTVRVDNSAINGNSTGLSFSGGGALLSFGNNNVESNGANGAFSGPVALK